MRDGLALMWARDLGVLPVVISGRPSAAVESRMKDLGVESYLGIKDKVAVAEQVRAREGVEWGQCAMLGDDLPDIPLLRCVGWAVGVAAILRHNGTWERVLRRYEVAG